MTYSVHYFHPICSGLPGKDPYGKDAMLGKDGLSGKEGLYGRLNSQVSEIS
jgi:hypothetical protein